MRMSVSTKFVQALGQQNTDSAFTTTGKANQTDDLFVGHADSLHFRLAFEIAPLADAWGEFSHWLVELYHSLELESCGLRVA